jgi:TfoX/Sxy family transcriptional regulator of competence genes
VLPAGSRVEEKKMFGGLAFLLGGHMGCGILDERLMVRVTREEYDEALREPHVHLMDFTGRPMRGFVYVDGQGIATDADLSRWVARGMRVASGLPPR